MNGCRSGWILKTVEGPAAGIGRVNNPIRLKISSPGAAGCYLAEKKKSEMTLITIISGMVGLATVITTIADKQLKGRRYSYSRVLIK